MSALTHHHFGARARDLASPVLKAFTALSAKLRAKLRTQLSAIGFRAASRAVLLAVASFGLAFILSFIGVKMLLPLVAAGVLRWGGAVGDAGFMHFVQRYANHEFQQNMINISLGVVVFALFLSIVLSLVIKPKEQSAE